jgi:radical SAM protein with 4Fe4S-binding SPASM domain
MYAHTAQSRIADEVSYYDVPDVDVPRRRYRGRCPDCWQSMGCARGCPNEALEKHDEEEIES